MLCCLLGLGGTGALLASRLRGGTGALLASRLRGALVLCWLLGLGGHWCF